MEENGYIDVFRILNENQKTFTWRRINHVKKQSRLDFYLVSEEIFHHVHDTSINLGIQIRVFGNIFEINYTKTNADRVLEF